MLAIEHLRRLAAWNAWANRLVFEVLRASNGEPPRALAAFQHVLEAEMIWLRRQAGAADADVARWGTASLEISEAWYSEARDRLIELMSGINEDSLADTFTYRNSRGTEYVDRLDDALLHMLLHSTRYRGETAAFLHEAGHPVPDIDYIFWLRLGQPA